MKHTKNILALILVLMLVVSLKDYIVRQSTLQDVTLEQTCQTMSVVPEDVPEKPLELIEEKVITTPAIKDIIPPADKEIKIVQAETEVFTNPESAAADENDEMDDNILPPAEAGQTQNKAYNAVIIPEPVAAVEAEEFNEEDAEDVMADEAEEEIGISIVQITLMDDYDGLGDIIFLPKRANHQVKGNIKGFRIVGNQENQPIYIVVQSQNDNNTETIQFLDWDKKCPNEFLLHSHLGIETSVTVYQEKEQIAHFYTEEQHGDDLIELSVNMERNIQLAVDLRNE